MLKRITVTAESTRCSTCMLNALCLPVGLPPAEATRLDELVKERIRLPKGQVLYHLSEHSEAVYGLRFGSLKTQIEDAAGQVQITSFVLPGEVLGLDALADDVHTSQAIALEDSEVCVIRLNELDQLAQHVPSLNQQFRRIMGREINRAQQMAMTLGALRSEQRLATFLLNLSQRLQALGYSSNEFILRMSREEIGNYLGLTLETVSRLFSRFARDGLLRIRQREVCIVDMPGLRTLAGTDCG